MITFHRHRWAFFLVFMVFLSLVGPTREGMSAHLSLSAWIPYWNRAEGEKKPRSFRTASRTFHILPRILMTERNWFSLKGSKNQRFLQTGPILPLSMMWFSQMERAA